MNFSNPCNGADFGGGKNENLKLKEYIDKRKGLTFTEFNTTQGKKGKQRRLDAILFPDMERGVYKSAGNYPKIKELIEKHPIELIEVHKWGFYPLGQLIGKEKILKKHWNPKETQKVLITLNPNRYHPKLNPDPLTKKVFDELDVEVFVPG